MLLSSDLFLSLTTRDQDYYEEIISFMVLSKNLNNRDYFQGNGIILKERKGQALMTKLRS